MYTKTLNLVSIYALLLVLWLRPAGEMRYLIGGLIFCTAGLIAWDLASKHDFGWLAVFGSVALLFNPWFIFHLSASSSLWIDSISLLAFLTLAFTRTMPRLTIQSIVDLGPRKDSL
jgi:hypothetical protein